MCGPGECGALEPGSVSAHSARFPVQTSRRWLTPWAGWTETRVLLGIRSEKEPVDRMFLRLDGQVTAQAGPLRVEANPFSFSQSVSQVTNLLPDELVLMYLSEVI